MPALGKLFSSSSSSPSYSYPSSPCDSPLKQASSDTNFFGSGGGKRSKRRLTRQRKLRHATNAELGLLQIDPSGSLPVSPDSGSRSPTWSAVAHPLPSPGLDTPIKQQSDRTNSHLSKEEGRDGTDGANPSTSAPASYFSNQSIKARDRVSTKSSRSPTYLRRGFPLDLHVESALSNFMLNVPPRSAPTSGLSSPALSPQRFRTVDLFHSSFKIPQEAQVTSILEVPASNKQFGSPRQVVSASHACTPDHSPLHSPKKQNASQNAKNLTNATFHSLHMSLPESSVGWPEGSNHANLHPLPLPPGGLKSSQSTMTCHVMEKQNVSLMKSKWRKGKLIGRGTYGSVYEAINCETGALCAMKEVDLIWEDPKSVECIKQLEQEMKVLQHLKHPNIVHYYGCEVVEDHFCIYLEYIHPGSINKFVREHYGAVTESIVRNFTRHVVSGLTYLHSMKMIHRDIKGANLLVNGSGVVKLADFGLAKHLAGCANDLSLKGSPHWMAPEVLQAAMRKDSNPQLAYAVDIWSLGCTVLEMLTGRPPWNGLNDVQAMFSVLHKSPPIPETLSSEGKDFLRQCFQRIPADRPSAELLLEHPFLRSSHDLDFPICTREFCEMKLTDTPHNPRGDRKQNMEGPRSVPVSPRARIRQLPYNGETSPKASRHSPCSTLDALPSMSSPDFNCKPHFIGSPMNPPNNLHILTGNMYHYASPRIAHGGEIQYHKTPCFS